MTVQTDVGLPRQASVAIADARASRNMDLCLDDVDAGHLLGIGIDRVVLAVDVQGDHDGSLLREVGSGLWVCQFVRAPGEKVTEPADALAGASGVKSISTRTVPVKCSVGAVLTGREFAREICRSCSDAAAVDSASAPTGANRDSAMTAVTNGFISTSRARIENVGSRAEGR